MKKILVVLLALLMVFGITGAVFADTNGDSYQDTGTINLSKKFLLANDGTSNMADTFTFQIKPHSVSDAGAGITTANMPMFLPYSGTDADRKATVSIAFAAGSATTAGATATTSLTLPTYGTVGVYTYLITETVGSTGGVSYDTNPMYLTVTVVQLENGLARIPVLHYGSETGSKTEYFQNICSAGSLQISKTVAGIFGDKTKFFDVKVKIIAEAGKTNYAAAYTVTGGSHASNPSTIAVGTETTFKLKHGETITIPNLPYGMTYTVVEDDYISDGYITAHNFSDEAKKIDTLQDSVGIVNTKGGTPDTGVSLDSLPYIVIAVLAGSGLVLYLARRRKLEE